MLYLGLRTLFRLYFYGLLGLKVRGLDNIPAEGPVIICANHISYGDPPLVGTPLQRRIYYMAKAELFQLPVLKQVLPRLGAFPVKRGGVSRDSIRTALKLLGEGKMLGIFPEGSRNAGGMGKKGAASFALKSEAVVIPAAIKGRYIPFGRLTLTYGKPIDFSDLKAQPPSEQLELATSKIMNSIGNLLKDDNSN